MTTAATGKYLLKLSTDQHNERFESKSEIGEGGGGDNLRFGTNNQHNPRFESKSEIGGDGGVGGGDN